MVFLLLILAVTTSHSLPICSTYCKTLLSGIAVTWRSECDCSYTPLPLDRNDTGIYYKPVNTDVESVYSSPVQRQFFIPNPVLTKNNVQTKNFRKRVSKFIKSTPRKRFSNITELSTQSINPQVNKNSSYFDVDALIDEMHNISNDIDLLKNNLIDCIELHILNHTRICNCTDIPSNFKFKNIKDNFHITEEELQIELAKKCHQITEIFEKSIKDIKDKGYKKNNLNGKPYNLKHKPDIEQKVDSEFYTDSTLLRAKPREKETELKRPKNAYQISSLFSKASTLPKNKYEYMTVPSLLKTPTQGHENIESDVNTILARLTHPLIDNSNSDENLEINNNVNKSQTEKLGTQTFTLENKNIIETTTAFPYLNITPHVHTETTTPTNVIKNSLELITEQQKPDLKDKAVTKNDFENKTRIIGKNINSIPLSKFNEASLYLKSIGINEYQNLPLQSKQQNPDITTEKNYGTGKIQNNTTVSNMAHQESESYESIIKHLKNYSLGYSNESENHIQDSDNKLNNDTKIKIRHTTIPVTTTFVSLLNDSSFSLHTISLNSSYINQNLTNTHNANISEYKEKAIESIPSEIINSFDSNHTAEENHLLIISAYKTTQVYEANSNELENNDDCDKFNKIEKSLNKSMNQNRPYKEVPIVNIVTREYPNGTIFSEISDTKLFPNNDIKNSDRKSNLQITNVKTNRATLYSEIIYLNILKLSGNENNNNNVKEDEPYNSNISNVNNTITGKLYFRYKDQLIPTQFVQNPDGNINVGINLSLHHNGSDQIMI